MRYFLSSAKVLAADFAATIVFLVLYETTHSMAVAAGVGLALGIGQVGLKLFRRQGVDALEWISLALVVMSSLSAWITGDPRFVMVKPTAIYVIIGVVMLKPGWMLRYVPPIARDIVPDVVTRWGYVWAGLMFVSAALNMVLALRLDVTAWALTMSVWGFASKAALFVVQFLVIRSTVMRKLRPAPAVAAA